MRSVYSVVLTVVQVVSTECVGKFSNPPPMSQGNQMAFSSNPVYSAGQVISVEWTTTYSEYTIALWQQDLVGDSAILGLIIFGMSVVVSRLWTAVGSHRDG